MVGLNFKLTTAGSFRDILGRGTFCWRASDRGGGWQERRGSRYLSGRSPLGVAVQSGQSPAANRAVHTCFGLGKSCARAWPEITIISSEGAPPSEIRPPPFDPPLPRSSRSSFGPELGPYFMGTFAWAPPRRCSRRTRYPDLPQHADGKSMSPIGGWEDHKIVPEGGVFEVSCRAVTS